MIYPIVSVPILINGTKFEVVKAMVRSNGGLSLIFDSTSLKNGDIYFTNWVIPYSDEEIINCNKPELLVRYYDMKTAAEQENYFKAEYKRQYNVAVKYIEDSDRIVNPNGFAILKHVAK